jgi:nitrate/TMAO reductase-like tetraheme cytochrome c subunit
VSASGGSFLGRAFRKALRLGWWSLLALPFLALPMNAGIEYSNSPDFCNSCHIMEPFYEAWKAGSHKDVACTKCHYPPDLEGKLWVKFQGLAQLVSYVTKTESTRPSAHVHDGSCTQCHELAKLDGELAFGKIRFRHDKHFAASTPGHELKCTSCHAQTTRDTHMAVDRAACNLCHFKEQPAGHAVGECVGCHRLPEKTVAPEGGGPAFEHGAVAMRGRACAECHAGVTRGTGDVAKTRCLQCHADPAALARYDVAIADREAADRLHFEHVKSAAVDCRSCHEEILHGPEAKRAAPSHAASGGDCRTCHADKHDPQREFALGKGARSAAGKPDFMAHLGMRCEACHREPPAAGGEGGGAALGDPEAACFACHGGGVRGMVDGWKLALRSWDDAARKDLAAAEAALGVDRPAAAREALAAVRADLQLVRKANGVHNFEYAAEIYRAAHEARGRRDGGGKAARTRGGGAPARSRGIPRRARRSAGSCARRLALAEGRGGLPFLPRWRGASDGRNRRLRLPARIAPPQGESRVRRLPRRIRSGSRQSRDDARSLHGVPSPRRGRLRQMPPRRRRFLRRPRRPAS